MVFETDNKDMRTESPSIWKRIKHNTFAPYKLGYLLLDSAGLLDPILILIPFSFIYVLFLMLIATHTIQIIIFLHFAKVLGPIIINSLIEILIFACFFDKTYGFTQYFNIAMLQWNYTFILGLIRALIEEYINVPAVMGTFALITPFLFCFLARFFIVKQFQEYNQKSFAFRFFFSCFIFINTLFLGTALIFFKR